MSFGYEVLEGSYPLTHPAVESYITTCTAAPYQIEGILVGGNGRRCAFYFRERHGRAVLGVGWSNLAAVQETVDPTDVRLSASTPCDFITSAEQLNDVFNRLLGQLTDDEDVS